MNTKFNRKQAADYIGINYQTLNNWAHSGKNPIPYNKFGRKVVYNQADLDKYIATTRVPADVEAA